MEVAAYRIAVEALINAARHSGAPPLPPGAAHPTGAIVMVRVLIAEDHPTFRDALQTILTLTGEFEVAAAVGPGEDAVTETVGRTPDVVVMDLEMPGGGGVAAIAEILSQLPATHPGADLLRRGRLVYAALRAGAHGYALKSATSEEIVRVVQTVARAMGCSPAAW